MDHFKRSKIPRPPDVLIPIWTEGQDTAIYVTVVNPLQQALVVRTCEDGDSAVAHAHKEKLRKSIQLLEYQMVRALCRFDTLGNLASSQ